MEGLGLADVIKIAAGSGVIAALLNSGIGWFKDKFQRNEQRRLEAEIDAIHLISKLDALASECARNFWEFHYHWDRSDGPEPDRHMGTCPKPILIIDPGSLSKIDRSIACRIAWIENDIRLGNDGIKARWEVYLDIDDAVAADADLVGYFGYEALLISRELRSKYGLTHQGVKWGMAKIEEQLKECSDRSKKFFSEHD